MSSSDLPTSGASPDAASSDASASDESGASSSDSGGVSWPRIVGFGLAAAILIGLAIPKIGTSDDDAQAQGASSAPPAMGVEAVVARPGPIVNRLKTTGTLRADESVELSSESGGKVTQILFEEGTRVQKGALLVQINDAELQAEKKRLEYRLTLASDRADRQEKLLERGGVSQEEYDETVNQVNVLESEIALVEAQIDKTQVRAPFTGTIGLRSVSEGTYLTPQTSIAMLLRIQPVKVDFSVPAKYAAQVQTGGTITFSVPGVAETLTGRIYAIEPQINPNTRSLQVRARADNPDGVLRAGAFADVTVSLGTRDDAIVVPAFAVVPSLGAQNVFVFSNGTARVRNVTLGLRSEDAVQITDGLAPGDTVITSGIQDLRDGLKVQVESMRTVEAGRRGSFADAGSE